MIIIVKQVYYFILCILLEVIFASTSDGFLCFSFSYGIILRWARTVVQFRICGGSVPLSLLLALDQPVWWCGLKVQNFLLYQYRYRCVLFFNSILFNGWYGGNDSNKWDCIPTTPPNVSQSPVLAHYQKIGLYVDLRALLGAINSTEEIIPSAFWRCRCKL